MFRLTVADVFRIKGRGLVATGTVESGAVRVGDELSVDGARTVKVKAIESFRKVREEAVAGDTIGLLLDSEDVESGAVLTGDGEQGISVPGLGLT